MADAKPGINILQIICMAVGIFIGMLFFQVVMGLGGIVGGALGGGLGAALGLVLYAVINKVKS